VRSTPGLSVFGAFARSFANGFYSAGRSGVVRAIEPRSLIVVGEPAVDDQSALVVPGAAEPIDMLVDLQAAVARLPKQPRPSDYPRLVPHAVFVALLVASPLVGVVTRRWLALLLPAFGWPVFYASLNQGWWGHGTGDGWEYAAVLLTVVGVLSTALAISAARSLRSDRGDTSTHGLRGPGLS
jgi:hypothetical protein